MTALALVEVDAGTLASWADDVEAFDDSNLILKTINCSWLLHSSTFADFPSQVNWLFVVPPQAFGFLGRFCDAFDVVLVLRAEFSNLDDETNGGVDALDAFDGSIARNVNVDAVQNVFQRARLVGQGESDFMDRLLGVLKHKQHAGDLKVRNLQLLSQWRRFRLFYVQLQRNGVNNSNLLIAFEARVAAVRRKEIFSRIEKKNLQKGFFTC